VEKVALAAELQGVRIVCVVPAGLTVTLDRRRIHRVLVNFLVNALEAMSQGGQIHIAVISEGHSI
jgi:signal transduction histidine kinase